MKGVTVFCRVHTVQCILHKLIEARHNEYIGHMKLGIDSSVLCYAEKLQAVSSLWHGHRAQRGLQ